VLLGQVEPGRIDLDDIQQRLDRPEGQRIAESLREVGFGSVSQMLATYAGRYEDLRPWLRDAQINYDGNLRLQYMAGMALNVSPEGSIYQDMLGYRKYRSNLFTGSEEKVRVMRSVLETGR